MKKFCNFPLLLKKEATALRGRGGEFNREKGRKKMNDKYFIVISRIRKKNTSQRQKDALLTQYSK